MSTRSRYNSKKIQETLLDFIRERLNDSRVYIHFTGDKAVADKILNEGFKYRDSFEKTTAEISRSKIDIKYKYQLYRDYGNFLIVICIPQKLFDHYHSGRIDTRHDSLHNLGVSEYHPGEELEYRLSPKYVYGYINLANNKVKENMGFLGS